MQKAAIAVPDGRTEPKAIPYPNTHPQPSRTRPPSRGWPSIIAAALAFSVILTAFATFVPVPAYAGGSCTGWKSITVPPDSIRVGRRDGSVDVVPFKKYVRNVMAKEWPNYIPKAAIEVGAVAVKQYAWYHALAGHHRSSFVNARGNCYDVVDTTRDQLYKPEEIDGIGDKIKAAVDKTWLLSLRKNGNFFMTGYRYGADVRCGADRDGRRVYERSVRDCARRGKSMKEIQAKYLNPGLSWHWADGGTITSLAPTSNSQPDPTPNADPTPAPESAPKEAPEQVRQPAAQEPELAASPFVAPATLDVELTGDVALSPYNVEPAATSDGTIAPATDDVTYAYLCVSDVGGASTSGSSVTLVAPHAGCAAPLAVPSLGTTDVDGEELDTSTAEAALESP